jgi:hypothetical protein
MIADSLLTTRRWKREAERLQAELNEVGQEGVGP